MCPGSSSNSWLRAKFYLKTNINNVTVIIHQVRQLIAGEVFSRQTDRQTKRELPGRQTKEKDSI